MKFKVGDNVKYIDKEDIYSVKDVRDCSVEIPPFGMCSFYKNCEIKECILLNGRKTYFCGKAYQNLNKHREEKLRRILNGD